MRADQDGGRWLGLPVVGFWAGVYSSREIAPWVLSSYADISRHRGSTGYQGGGFVAPGPERRRE